MAGGKSSTLPAPPEAMIGILTSLRTARIISRSKPSLVPSASIELSRISPAPSCSARLTHQMASMPVDLRPPIVVTSKPDCVCCSPFSRRASTESTSTWLPKRSATRLISDGSLMAAVLTPTLSAPQRSSESTSSGVRTPPPTVIGMNTCSAVRETTSIIVLRWELDAVTSRKVISSAP